MDRKHRKQRPSSLLDPDTYFWTFIVNVFLVLVTITNIFSQRKFHEEYFIRRNILTVFDQERFAYTDPDTGEALFADATKFSDVQQFQSFEAFLTTTLAYGLFFEEQGQQGLPFSSETDPLGKLVLRVQ